MKHAWNVVLVVVSLVFCYPALGFAASILVNWNANTESDLAGYIIYYGTQSGVYSTAVDVGKVTSYQFNNVGTGKTYYLALTAYDTSGNESGYSSEASVYVPTTTTPTPTTPTLSIVSPTNGAVLSSAPTLTWKGTGLVRYGVYASRDGSNYTTLYTGTGTSFPFPSTYWNSYRSGTRIYWYVAGRTSSGQIYKTSRYSFSKR